MEASLKSAIKEYYSNFRGQFWLDNLKFRHFRFNQDGTFVKIDKRLHSKGDLSKILIQNCPSDAYYSVSCFMNPHLLGPKAEKGATFLKSDLVFDLDTQPSISIDDVRCKTLELIDLLTEKCIKIKYSAFSGSKGFHVVCDSESLEEPHPEKREQAYLETHRNIANEILHAGIPIDAKVTADTRRIFRIPGTINSKTGYVCTVMARKVLEMPMEEIFKKVDRVFVPAPRIPLLENDRVFSISRTIRGWLNRIGARSPSNTISSFISSKVLGTPLSILILKHRINTKLENLLSELQQVYHLSDFYVFRHENFFYSICLKPLQSARIIKILKAAQSLNFTQFLKYSLAYFPVGRKRDFSMKVLAAPPQFLFTISSANSCALSKPHTDFFMDMGLKINKQDNAKMIGKISLDMLYAIFD